jgi:hypothetical protein
MPLKVILANFNSCPRPRGNGKVIAKSGLWPREEAASQPQSNGKAIEVSIFLQAHIQTKRENPFAAAQQPLCHGFAIASPRLPIAYTFEKCYTFT